jgi:hypothetical protein
MTSWLCALAHRNDVTWQQMLTAVGLHRRPGDMKRLGWVGHLHAHEIAALATATEVDARTLTDMTFARFDYLGITTGRRPRRPDFGAMRGSPRPLRYCPRCLIRSPGRRQLQWSLGWSFACAEHECLLADKCPECLRRPQRHVPLAGVIPDLSTCGQPTSPTHVCGVDLRRAAPEPVTCDELAAQRAIDAVIDGNTKDFTIYREHAATCSQVLADLRVLARMLKPEPRTDLSVGLDQPSASNPMPRSAPGVPTVYAESARNAAALAVAVQVLRSPDIKTGAQRMGTRLARAPVGRWLSAFARSAVVSHGTTPVLAAVQLSAIGPQFGVADQLRYRVYTDRPHAPRRPAAALARATRALPTLMWAEWAERMIGMDCQDAVVRTALSCAVALVGTEADVSTIGSLLRSHIEAPVIAATLWRFRSQARWPTTAQIITELANLIAAQPNSIDYHRRRILDYDSLLPGDEWTRICRDISAAAEMASDIDAARCVLFERLSGWPVSQARWFVDEPNFHQSCRRLLKPESAAVTTALDTIATKFLAGLGIDEPVSAVPAPESVECHPVRVRAYWSRSSTSSSLAGTPRTSARS